MSSGIILPKTVGINEQSYARLMNRVGFVPLKELGGSEPHYGDAIQLDKALRSRDHRLELGYTYDPMDHRDNRWAIRRWNEDGSTYLVRVIQDQQTRAYQPPDMRVIFDLQENSLEGKRGDKWVDDAAKQADREEEKAEAARLEGRERIKEVVSKASRDIRFKGMNSGTALITKDIPD